MVVASVVEEAHRRRHVRARGRGTGRPATTAARAEGRGSRRQCARRAICGALRKLQESGDFLGMELTVISALFTLPGGALEIALVVPLLRAP
jgi:hypothetical protein